MLIVTSAITDGQEFEVVCAGACGPLPAVGLLDRGGGAAFVSQTSVLRYLEPQSPKPLAYGVGAVSGTILALYTCMVLPLFAGI